MTGAQNKLIFIAQQWEDVVQTGQVEDLNKLASPGIVLHKDSVTLQSDLKGLDQVKNYYRGYAAKYDYKHSVLASAAWLKDNIAFTFTLDDDVKPKDGVFTKLDDKDTAPSRSVGIFKYVVNSEGLVTDIWFQRQPSKDEIARKFKNPPDYSEMHLSPAQFEQYKLHADADRTAKMHSAAVEFNNIWKTGDVGAVPKIFKEDYKDWNLLFGGVREGRQPFSEMIKMVFKSWRPQENKSDIAVTPDSNKAFIHWSASGEEADKGLHDEFYGMNMLLFDPKDCLITDVFGFRQPMASERPSLLK
eukprot:jgi/Astpho2/7219/Aster-01532